MAAPGLGIEVDREETGGTPFNATRSVLFEPVARGLFALHVFALYLAIRN